MENLHLKNLKNNIPDISELYINQYNKLLDIQKNVIKFAEKTKMKNHDIEEFKNLFLRYFKNKNYHCVMQHESFHEFTQIVTELNSANIGTNISKTNIYLNHNVLYFPFSFEKQEYNDDNEIIIQETELTLWIKTKDGVITNITIQEL